MPGSISPYIAKDSWFFFIPRLPPSDCNNCHCHWDTIFISLGGICLERWTTYLRSADEGSHVLLMLVSAAMQQQAVNVSVHTSAGSAPDRECWPITFSLQRMHSEWAPGATFYVAFHRSQCGLKTAPWNEMKTSRTLKTKWVTPCPLPQLKREEVDPPLSLVQSKGEGGTQWRGR